MLPLTKRQREILDYLNEFIQQHGYAPSLEEIGRRFGLSSLAKKTQGSPRRQAAWTKCAATLVFPVPAVPDTRMLEPR